VVSLLLEEGADADAQAANGATPLHNAAAGGHGAVAQVGTRGCAFVLRLLSNVHIVRFVNETGVNQECIRSVAQVGAAAGQLGGVARGNERPRLALLHCRLPLGAHCAEQRAPRVWALHPCRRCWRAARTPTPPTATATRPCTWLPARVRRSALGSRARPAPKPSPAETRELSLPAREQLGPRALRRQATWRLWACC
jgi:hypothetical protein